MLDEDRAPIENRQYDNQPTLDQEVQLVRHGASPGSISFLLFSPAANTVGICHILEIEQITPLRH
jgi:hypothetical protein